MQKISILSLLFISFTSLHAQVKKGSVFLGGNIGGYTQTTQTVNNSVSQEQNGIMISPVFGKAIKDNLILGGDLGFTFSKNDLEQAGTTITTKQHSYGAGIFLRQYKPIGKGFYLFLQGRLGVDYSKTETTPNFYNDNVKRITAGFSAYPGISYAVTRKLHLETGFNNLLYINYSNEKGERLFGNANKYETNGFSIGSSISNLSSLYVGFRVLIGK